MLTIEEVRGNMGDARRLWLYHRGILESLDGTCSDETHAYISAMCAYTRRKYEECREDYKSILNGRSLDRC